MASAGKRVEGKSRGGEKKRKQKKNNKTLRGERERETGGRGCPCVPPQERNQALLKRCKAGGGKGEKSRILTLKQAQLIGILWGYVPTLERVYGEQADGQPVWVSAGRVAPCLHLTLILQEFRARV